MKVNGKNYPIYDMENKIHVWNHQPNYHVPYQIATNWGCTPFSDPQILVLVSLIMFNLPMIFPSQKSPE